LIRLTVDHLPGDRSPEPLWLWSSRAGTDADAVNCTWQAFLRRFDIEHMFRFFKQVLGWTRPKLRDPAAADRWTWIVITCYAHPRTTARPPALTWVRPSSATSPRRKPAGRKVKQQAKNQVRRDIDHVLAGRSRARPGTQHAPATAEVRR
jgi:hypothetical protein